MLITKIIKTAPTNNKDRRGKKRYIRKLYIKTKSIKALSERVLKDLTYLGYDEYTRINVTL